MNEVLTTSDAQVLPQARPASSPTLKHELAESTLRGVEALIRQDRLNEAVQVLKEARRLEPAMVDHIYARTLILRAARKERDGNLEGALADYLAARSAVGVKDMADQLDAIIIEVQRALQEKHRLEPPPQSCNTCGREVEPGEPCCPYCGGMLPRPAANEDLAPAAAGPSPQAARPPAGKVRHITDLLRRLENNPADQKAGRARGRTGH